MKGWLSDFPLSFKKLPRVGRAQTGLGTWTRGHVRHKDWTGPSIWKLGYLLFKPAWPLDLLSHSGLEASMLQHGTRSKIVEKGVPHLPFEEFKVESLEQLLKQLETYKIAGSKIEVSESESAHSYCEQSLIHILVPVDHYPVNRDVYREMELLYQYCPSCRLAVRVL